MTFNEASRIDLRNIRIVSYLHSGRVENILCYPILVSIECCEMIVLQLLKMLRPGHLCYFPT